MIQLKEYVKNRKEIEIVSEVRKDYVKKYIKFIIDQGNIKKGCTVMDIPCGTGDMAKAISEKIDIRKFVLVDINENMVNVAKEKITKGGLGIVADAGDIGKKVNFKVDTIICLNGFHQYFGRKEDFLDGCKKILKKGGRLIFDISTRGLNDEYTRMFFENQREEVIILSKKYSVKPQLPIWPNNPILEKYRRMITDNGLTLIAEREFTTFKTISQIISDAIKIPGRSRPWFPKLDYNQRKEILKKSIERTKAKLGERKIEHNRIFFVSENVNDPT